MEINLNEGESLFSSGKILEAEQLFIALIEKGLNRKEAYNNLGAIAFQRNDAKSAIDYFTRSLEIDPFYKDAIINYTDLLSTLDQVQLAIPLLEKIIQNDPTDREITNILEEILSVNKNLSKVAVICTPGFESFLGDIVAFLKTRYEVKVCYSTNVQELETIITWSDIVWLEWANELTIVLTNHPGNILKDKHVICRLHSYEAFEGFARKINWKNIGDLIFVARHIRDIVIQQVPDISKLVNNIHIIPNGIDLAKFSLKDIVRGKNIAFVGSLNSRKGPMLLLHAFRELVIKDNEYQLFIAGAVQDPRYHFYFSQMMQEMDLERNIKFDGWINDINSWLEDKQYIVCASVLEGHPVGLMEAMAKGLKPLIHNFVGARGIYPEKYIWNTISDFVKMTTEDSFDPAEYRRFIETNYILENQLDCIDKIIQRTCNERIAVSLSADRVPAELSK
ncbi:MAG: glycosyltransferase [Maribacter sp.]|nr:glycosyltransferase [Maribacter sp.]